MLCEKLAPLVLEQGTARLYNEIEMPLVEVLARMEQTGVALDQPFLSELSQRLDQDLRQIEGEVMAVAGETFNLNSPQQLSRILFEVLNLPTQGVKKTKPGPIPQTWAPSKSFRPFIR